MDGTTVGMLPSCSLSLTSLHAAAVHVRSGFICHLSVCRSPKLLICDEATSALDTATERGIMDSLTELASGRTSVFVAHRYCHHALHQLHYTWMPMQSTARIDMLHGHADAWGRDLQAFNNQELRQDRRDVRWASG